MSNESKAIFGASVTAVGTVIAAVGATPFRVLSKPFRLDLSVIGNVMQGVGNGIEADTQEPFSLGRIGNEIQSLGNSTVVAGLIINFDDETKQKLVITGNWFQALGGTAALGPEFSEPDPDLNDGLSIIGNILQVTGNSLQAINGIENLKKSRIQKKLQYPDDGDDDDGSFRTFDVVGSWIQATGAVISLISTIGIPECSRFGYLVKEDDPEDPT
ncbi:hypothetical protein Q0N12_12970 [Rossellomorea marisflavi]|uniref:DUF6944 family repetitive protein n=1 Tax=Rossellomorea marisflavi TaxID=189381 RepID=UPI000A57E64A|nr:hypothetical protein [Rossellomorea marisflavi]MCM2591357.1 hypothetical protein [Rossellomorea marisflavi]UTE73916.1 hypothetical protein M1I95_05240 [Rossellomorea marisflavi]